MYGLPPNFDFLQFKSRQLEMVCFTKNSMYLHFSNEIMMTVEAPFLYESAADEHKSGWLEFPVVESKIMRLLGCEVALASVGEDGTFTLYFVGGDRLSVSEIKDYESYRIKTKTDDLIV